MFEPKAGLNWFFLILFFLIFCSILTKYQYGYKRLIRVAEPPTGRGMSAVIGNGLVPATVALTGEPIVYAAAVAAATADTAATEIGILSKKSPRLILSWERVGHGTPGAVSFVGLITALLSSLLIGVAAYLLIMPDLKIIIIATVVGFLSCQIDSLMNCLFRRKGMLNKTETNFFATLFGAAAGALALVI
jgi:uncharacterized protein (TIGR00297 family)